MPKIPEIKFDEITVAEKYADGYEYERCKNGLWSIHNVIKKISNTAHPRIIECLCNIGVHAAFKNGEMTSLVFAGLTRKDYKRGLPAAKYMFELEKYGFIFTDIAAVKKDMHKTKLASKDIIRFTLSYNADDFADVIFGLKLFTDACMDQPNPLNIFLTADIRAAFANDSQIIISPPPHEMDFKEQKANKPPVEDLCEHFLTDDTLKKGMSRLLELSRELKMKPLWYGFNKYKCSYKGKRVVVFNVGGKVQISKTNNNWLRINILLADRQDLLSVLLAQPEDVRSEYLSGKRVCNNCAVCANSMDMEISGKTYNVCTGFGYVCENPTPEQFGYIEKFINIRRNYIDTNQ